MVAPNPVRMAFNGKSYISCLLLLSVLLQTFSKTVICVDFYANQDYIAKTLCENRDKPLLHCCGRCQLRKRLHQDAEKDKDNPSRKADGPTAPLFREETAPLHIVAPEKTLPSHAPWFSDRSVVDQPSFCFHPPD
jgi:hypothetical protein